LRIRAWAPTSRLDAMIRWTTSRAGMAGYFERTSATAALVKALASLVPLLSSRLPSTSTEVMSTPGAAAVT
jgi:hypothetical protein